jgi:glutathione S-transferase
MLTVHHLGKSQSERIVWLCEELDIPYELRRYDRDPVTILAPPEYKALHPIGSAPVIVDGGLVLAESGAIIEYILAKYGAGRLAPGPADPSFADYLYWFHFANGTLMPSLGRSLLLRRIGVADDQPLVVWQRGRLDRAFDLVEARLGDAAYFAGEAFTAADIIMGFPLTTMRYFTPRDLSPYPHLRAYLKRIGERDAYQRAMRKADPDMVPMLA